MEFKTLGELIGKYASTTPNKVAIERGTDQVTYKELEEKTNKLANFLKENMDSVGNIPVIFENSIQMVEAILGIVKTGGIFAPVDPNFPKNRIKLMLEEVDADWVITQGEWLHKLDELLENQDRRLNTILLDSTEVKQDEFKNLKLYPMEEIVKREAKVVNSNNKNCYIYFTSGSTGKPKGILGRHISLVHFIEWEIKEFGVKEDFRGSQLTSPSFDPFLRDTFVPLCAGATLCIPENREIVMKPKELIQWLEEEKITLVHMVPTLFKAMMREIDDGNHFKDLKYILLAGELLRGNDVKKFINLLGNKVELVNLYGPTETTLAKFFYRITKSDVDKPIIPVGKPIPGAQVLVLNNALMSCDIGSIGEVYIRTPFTSSGYYNNKELTRKVFIRNPLSNNPKDIIYKTGDTGRILPTGDLELIGRVDHQVKIRGFRIEVGEIENTLLAYPGIKEAVIIASETGDDGKSLWGYVTGENPPKVEVLKKYLGRELPAYMVPSYIIHLDKLPLTPNGKVDRKALPKFDENMMIEMNYLPPTNDIEKTLVEIWKHILKIEKVGITNNFFDLGGHSLKATAMAAEIHKAFNVEVPIRVIFKSPTIQALGKMIEESVNNDYISIEPVENQAFYQLSSAQKRTYLIQQMDKNSVSYNIPRAVILDGNLNLQLLESCFRKLLQRHETLRTSFKLIEDVPVQLIHNEVDFNLQYIQGEEKDLDEILKSFIQPFDLEKAPLLRVCLVKIMRDRHLLLFDLHHIISDGTSMGLLIKELSQLYQGKNLEPLRIQYKDYSHWQREMIDSGKLEKQKKYWLEQMEGEIPVLNLMGDYPRPAIHSFEGEILNFQLEEELSKGLRKICKETGATQYMVLLSVFNVLLSKYSGQEDIIIGSPIAGRTHADLDKIIGMFVNTLALRNYPVAEISFKEFLTKVKHNALKAYENQGYQFEELVENLNLRRDLSRNPLFDVMFAMHNMEIGELIFDGITIKPYSMGKHVSKFDITLSVLERENDIYFGIAYATKIFKQDTIKRLYRHFGNILKQITENLNIKLGDIDLTTVEEKQYLLEELNDTKAAYPTDKTLHQLFEEQVLKTPNNIAVIYGERQLTYKDLDKKANRLAGRLRKKGVKANDLVAIVEGTSLEMIIGILATLKAGGAFLPIDEEFPKKRRDYILADSGVQLVLTSGDLVEEVRGDFKGEVICIEEDDMDEAGYRDEENSNLQPISKSDDLIYTIYTSGTTGKGKGVLINHNNIVNYLNWFLHESSLGEGDQVLLLSSFAFDLGYTTLFSSLVAGCQLHLLNKETYLQPEKLLNYIEENQISYMKLTPSHYRTLVDSKDFEKKLNSLRLLLLGGEEIKPQDVEKTYGAYKNIEIMNHYGPTETTIGAIAEKIKRNGLEDFRQTPTIGKAIANAQALILDANNRIQPMGVVGELCISGKGVGSGYLNRPELTAEKFIKHPYLEGEILYKTGDLARYLSDGKIQFLGRIDHQVKIRGYRIELGEVENKLLSHPHIKESIVVTKEDLEGSKVLVAYFVSDEELSVTEVREYLCTDLPEYMIPSYILQLEKLPLTPNGKVDQKNLPEPEGKILTGVEYEAPRDEIEDILVEIWREILSVEGFGINDNFFELGGHSLRATSMMAKIHKAFSVEVPLMEMFKNPTIKGIGEYIKKAQKKDYIEIKAVEEQEYYTASAAQRRLYALQQFQLENTSYNMPRIMILEGSLDIERLKAVFEKLIQRHEALRTSFEMLHQGLVQYIHGDVKFTLQRIEATEEELEGIVKDFIKAFDLSKAPLFRVGLVRLDEEKHIIITDLHHIISDGVSTGILVKEFAELYNGITPEELRIQYKDYSLWQKDLFDSGKIEEQKKYWLQQFEGELPVLNLMGDYLRPAIQSFEGDRLSYRLDEEVTSSLREICKKTGTTMYMVLLAAFNVLLAKYSGQEDIVVGSPIAGRPHADLDNIMGMFVNTLAMRNYPQGEKSFKEFLEEAKTNALGAYKNQEYQFEELVEQLNLRRDISRNPLFDVMFTMQNMDIGQLTIEGLSIKPYGYKNTISKFDMTLMAIETTDTINFGIEYATKIFKRETIERFYRHLENILDQITENLEIKLSEIQLVKEEEKKQLLEDFNNTHTDYPKEKTLHQLFEEQVEKTPENTAVVYEGTRLTYYELNKRANQLARVLRRKGVKADTIVGIMMNRSLEMIVGLWGILKAGGAYLPIDPDYPTDRITYMLEDSGTELLITESSLEQQILFDGEIIDIRDENIALEDCSNLENINQSSDLCYVIYTSGSTGKPKGNLTMHYNVGRLLKNANYIEITQEDTILQLSNYAFDGSVFDIYTTLTNGGKLILMSKETASAVSDLSRVIKEEKVTVFFVTTALFNVLVDVEIGCFQGIRKVLFGGERVSVQHTKKALEYMGPGRILHVYGPTESTVYATYYEINHIDDRVATIPIGAPLSNTEIFITDGNMNLQPVGVEGEIWIAGDGLARGYLNRPELTAERFIHHPFAKEGKLYKTGDLGRWLPDGSIEFLGRIDHQVKIRGFRIELGEIESLLLSHEAINEAIVLAKENNSNKYLCSYITLKEEIDVKEIKRYLAKELPEYMIPPYIIPLDQMPLTSNGKVDRKALPEPDGSMISSSEYEAPRNETDQTLVEIWQEVLGVEGIGINDNFFEVGGNSISIIKVANEIEKRLEVKFSIANLYLNNTIKDIADNIFNDSILNDLECVVKLNKSTSDKNIFLIHGYDGDVFYYKDLAKLLEDEYTVYGIQSKGFVKEAKLPETPQEMLDNYLKEIKMIQQEGPYLLGGFCIGVHLSYELTRMLEDEGEKVEKLLMLDGAAFITEGHLKVLNRKEKAENGKGLFKQLTDHSVEKSLDKLLQIKEKRQLKTSGDFQFIKKTEGESVVDKDRIKANIRKIIYTQFLVRRKIKTPVAVIKAMENDDPRVDHERWEKIVNAPVEFLETPGNHETMLLEPNVGRLAELVRDVLKGM